MEIERPQSKRWAGEGAPTMWALQPELGILYKQ